MRKSKTETLDAQGVDTAKGSVAVGKISHVQQETQSLDSDWIGSLGQGEDLSVASQIFEALGISRALTIPGWMSEDELNWLANIASHSQTCVEIGSYKGRSSRAIADNLPQNGHLYCIDSFKPFDQIPPIISSSDEGEQVCAEFKSNLSDLIESGKVTLYQLGSYQAALTIDQRHYPWIDFLFIDGDHSHQAVSQDIRLWLPLVKSGGVISGHDYCIYPGVTQAVNERFGKAVTNSAGCIWSVKL